MVTISSLALAAAVVVMVIQVGLAWIVPHYRDNTLLRIEVWLMIITLLLLSLATRPK